MALRDTVDVLRVLGDPTRLRLVALLHQHGTLCVCELERAMRLPQYSISRHLGILRHAGVVLDERNGARVDYHLSPELSEADRTLLAAVVEHLHDDAQVAADRQAAENVRPATCSPAA